MTTLGAENTYNIKYTLASEDNKVLHGIETDDMGEHFIESADEDLATFKMDWPNDNGLCWGRVTEHPQDNDYFYTVTDGTSLNVTSGAVIESLVVDRLPLVGWDCWTNMNTVNNIFNMLDGEYTVTIGDYTFNMIDDKAHLAENIEKFKKALSKYGSKRPGYISSVPDPSTSVVFKIKNDIIDYKQVFPILKTTDNYKFTITEDNFLYKLQNIWNRVILGQQSYFKGSHLLSSSIDFNLALSNKLQRDTLTIQHYEDAYNLGSFIDGKNDTVVKKIFITTPDPVNISNFNTLDYIEQNGVKDYYSKYHFKGIDSDDAKSIKYIISKYFSTKAIELEINIPKVEQLTIDRAGGLPKDFLQRSRIDLLKTLTLLNITEIGDNSFQGLPNAIEKIELPSTLLKIGANCFSVMIGITEDFSIIVPESVTEIGENAFRNVPKLYYKGTATGAPWGANEVITEF